MSDQYSISGNGECEQSDKKSSISKTPGELENYKNFFNLVTSNDSLDLDVDVDVSENTHTMKRF